MKHSFENRLIKYRAMIALLNQMLSQGMIDHSDFTQGEAIMARKYGFPENSIFREIT